MNRFRADIEGLRAIAVGAVILYHARVPYFTGGYVGVDVFFVISGFLITGLLLRDSHMRPGAYLARFYGRRARRILPAATLVIVVTLLAAALLQNTLLRDSTGDDAVSAMFFFSNIRFAYLATDYFNEGSAPSLFQHFWSLSVEEQFYLLWPALIVAVLLLARRRQRVGIGVLLAVGGLASFVLSVRLTDSNPTDAFFLLPSRAWELCVGAALAMTAARISFGPRTAVALRVAGLALIGAAIVVLGDETAFPGFAALMPVAGSAAVIAAGIPAQVSPGRLLTVPPMQWGGRYSYSLYLWHWPVLQLAALERASVTRNWKEAVAVTAVVTLPAALASYHIVEHPFRTSFGRKPDSRSLFAGAGLAAAFVAALIAFNSIAVGDLDAGRPAATHAVPEPQHAVDFVPSNLRPTLQEAHRNKQTRERAACRRVGCPVGDPAAPFSVVLYGDSHAGHWVVAFAEMARRNGWRFESLNQPGCRSFVEPRNRAEIADCAAFRERSNKRIRAVQPDLVVFSNQSATLFQRRPEVWASGVGEAIDALPPGVGAAILSQTPGQAAGRNVPLCLAEHVDAVRSCEPNRRVFDTLNAATRDVAAKHGAAFVDITSWLCTETRCPAIMGSMLVYRDANHLTLDFTLTRSAAMGELLKPLLEGATR